MAASWWLMAAAVGAAQERKGSDSDSNNNNPIGGGATMPSEKMAAPFNHTFAGIKHEMDVTCKEVSVTFFDSLLSQKNIWILTVTKKYLKFFLLQKLTVKWKRIQISTVTKKLIWHFASPKFTKTCQTSKHFGRPLKGSNRSNYWNKLGINWVRGL